MSQIKRKPLLNRKETQTLLTTLKIASTAGVLSLTLAGWGALAQLDVNTAQAASGQTGTITAAPSDSSSTASPSTALPTSKSTTRQVRKLDIVQWVRDARGNKIAVVRDRRGSLWYVMGSDVPRLEQGLSPKVRPRPVRVVTRTRAS
jgi:hypothetical protein